MSSANWICLLPEANPRVYIDNITNFVSDWIFQYQLRDYFREIVRDITTPPLTNRKEGCSYIPCLFVLYLFCLCISRQLLVLHVDCFILRWCETLFVFVSTFCNEVVWSLKWTYLWLDVSAAIIWTLFRLFDKSSGSWRMYNLGSALLLVIVTGFLFPVWLSNKRTSCPETSGGRSWAVLSWYIFCISFLCFSSSWIWLVLENLGVETLAIKFDLKMRLFKSSAGLGRLWLISVFRKHNIAKLGSLPACLALIRALLIVWICLSIKPFDFGNFGDDVMWSNCHCWANSLNASLEYCDQLSLTTMLGILCSENTCFIVDMTILLVVRPFIFRIIGNLL